MLKTRTFMFSSHFGLITTLGFFLRVLLCSKRRFYRILNMERLFRVKPDTTKASAGKLFHPLRQVQFDQMAPWEQELTLANDTVYTYGPLELKQVRHDYLFYVKLLLWRVWVCSHDWVICSLDKILVLLALLVASPILLSVVLLIKLTSKGPVFFKQERMGQFGKPFPCYKFRTMIVNADQLHTQMMAKNESADGVIFKMKDDPRITWIGKYLRKFSLDELPQLINILKSEMAIVGPRPPLRSEYELYSPSERKRLNVRPGLTCFWQISGRSLIPFKQQVILDRYYVQQRGVWVNLRIILKTIPAVLLGKGAY